MDWDLYAEMFDLVGTGRIGDALALGEAALVEVGPGRFEGLLGRPFTNDPVAVHGVIAGFVASEDIRSTIAAVYVEMNGFTVNPDEWYASCFGYDTPPPSELWEWLPDWTTRAADDLVLTGMEPIQAAFREHHAHEEWNDPDRDTAAWCAEWLVIVRLVELVDMALRVRPLDPPVPVLASAHGADRQARWDPPSYEIAT